MFAVIVETAYGPSSAGSVPEVAGASLEGCREPSFGGGTEPSATGVAASGESPAFPGASRLLQPVATTSVVSSQTIPRMNVAYQSDAPITR